MIGRRIAHYEILDKLGQGGMGEVYRAHDTKLGRDVALKVLPEDAARDPERHARFVREARSIAALKHPNIVTVYSVEESDGVTFLTMELVEGRSLSEVIPADGMRLDRFFDHAIPLSDAIGFAHDRGITHRDLKPGNIMIDRDGRLKVLDFGLAKVFAVGSGLESMETVVRTHDTAAGRILGTPAYMSPEQAEGKNIDHRSDIFSLGIVLYEMATGKRPFEGDTPISTISAILKDQPKSVSELKPANPRELGRIVSHCLEKDPERRFQTAKDVRNELEGLRKEVDSGEIVSTGSMAARDVAASEKGRGSVRQSSRAITIVGVVLGLAAVVAFVTLRNRGHASSPAIPEQPAHAAIPGATGRDRQMAVVLPFENLGPAEDAYFAAGVTEEITSRLTTVSGLGVISRTSAENYTQTGKTTKQIGTDLGVDYILEGSVRWAKTPDGRGRVRITPQLVRVADDTPVWTETYDREMSDIFEVQTDIATHVVDALGVTLQGSERASLEEQPTSNVEAYQLYLRAKNFLCNNVDGCDKEIVSLYEQALALDPKFLAAWYELTRQHLLQYHSNLDRTEARLARAKASLDHMEAIDPNHPLTRLARGYYYYHGYRDYDRALVEFNAVAEARPNDANAIFSVALIHRRRGELEETVKQMERAAELDPKNVEILDNLADTYDAMRMPDRAQEDYERTLAVRNDPFVMTEMVQSNLRHHGDLAAARRLLANAPDPDSPALTPAKVTMALYGRDFAGALKIMRSANVPMPSMRAQLAGFTAVTEAQMTVKPNAPALEDAARQLEAALRDAPGDYQARQTLANVYAYAGHAQEAIGQAKLAVDLIAKDAYAGPGALVTLAGVYAHTGHPDEALDLIERLLGTNYDDPLTVSDLRLDPYWDPLRDNPRFKALLKPPS